MELVKYLLPLLIIGSAAGTWKGMPVMMEEDAEIHDEDVDVEQWHELPLCGGGLHYTYN